jgi:hypothetical protein
MRRVDIFTLIRPTGQNYSASQCPRHPSAGTAPGFCLLQHPGPGRCASSTESRRLGAELILSSSAEFHNGRRSEGRRLLCAVPRRRPSHAVGARVTALGSPLPQCGGGPTGPPAHHLSALAARGQDTVPGCDSAAAHGLPAHTTGYHCDGGIKGRTH